MSYTQIENILGQPIPDYIINQLRIRSKKTLDKRDNQALVYTANKSGWVRVVSSVDISGSLAGINTANGADLAKSNVLFGGLSAYKGNNTYSQSPYYSSNPDTARKNQFDTDYGFRPMPGITSAKIITQGKLGSILIAEIDFKANTKQQLDLVDILYFKVGYSMLVEWGNTFFYKQKSTDANNNLETYETLYKSEDYAVDPFTDNPSKEAVRIAIAKSMKQTEGNYGGMLGVVTNYGFTMNAEGGYDCKIKIMSPGMLAESMRVNSIQSLPKIYYDTAIQNLANVYNTVSRQNAETERARQLKEQQALSATKSDSYPPCVKKLIDDGKLKTQSTENGQTAAIGVVAELKGYQFYNTDNRYLAPDGKTYRYTCEQTTNRVLDKDQLPFPGQDYTAQEFIARIKDKTLPPSKYSLSSVYSTRDSTNEIGYTVYDNVAQKRYYYSKGLSKLILTQEGQTDKGGNKAKLSIDENSLRIFTDAAGTNLLTVLSEKAKGKQYGNFKLTEYDDKDDKKFGFGENLVTLYEGEYNNNGTYKFNLYYKNTYGSVKGIENTINTGGSSREKENRQAVEKAIFDYVNDKSKEYTIERFFASAYAGNNYIIQNIVASAEVTANIWVNKDTSNVIEASQKVELTKEDVKVKFTIEFDDERLINALIPSPTGFIDPVSQNQQNPQPNETQQAQDQALEYPTINASELSKTEQAMYTSQLEAMLRMVQITTIGDSYGDGTINSVKKIEWTSKKYSDRLYNGLFSEGAMMTRDGQSILKQVITATSNESTGKIFENGSISDDAKNRYVNGGMTNLPRYTMNLYYGFHRGMMKTDDVKPFKDFDKPEYKVNFKELLTSYVIPYYQSKTLIDGADIHYPSYIPLGFFFMMLNHCSFLYDTSDNISNIPMFYLDFNQGTNIMLSSDFMLTSNPYKFVVPFTGDLKSYKKLYGPGIINSDGMTVGSGSEASPLWVNDAVSDYIPRFKYVDTSTSGISPYRGKTMNVLVSIDYLLDVVKRHAKIDETNSVYFRPLMEELLSDLGKCLGNFNIFRLAYDDYSNCFYVVDDQTIPGDYTYFQNSNKNIELPLFGKDSIARSLTINTENSSKLGSLAFISSNQDVRNQSTLGIDGTSIGNLSLYAVDRYKKLATAPNDNKKPADSPQQDGLQQKQLAASTFNQAVESFYHGGLRSEAIVDQATNYYIEAVARTRAGGEDENVRASSLLPVSVNFSTDGISSMAIYQAFTISDELLPYSYKYGMNQSETRKMGFIITGLEHTIQNNAWTTDVRANMYYVKRQGDYKTQIGKQTKADRFKDLPSVLLNNATQNGIISYRTNFVTSRDQKAIDARKITEQYLGRTLIDNDWNCLIAAAYAESNYKDRARQATWCAAVMVNRSRKSGRTIYEELTLPLQFQAVTGTSKNGNAPSDNYVKGPSSSIEFTIYDGIIKELAKIDKRYVNFTSNLNSAYGEGTDISYKTKLENSPGKIIVGDTIYSFA